MLVSNMDLSLFDLSGRKALVAGGASGIGRASAFALAMGGADVAIADLSEQAGLKTVEALRATGRDAMFVPCNVTDGQQVQTMVDTVANRFGRLDIAVNNAGIYRATPDEQQSQEEWETVIGVNLTGVWLCAQAQMRQMIKQNPVEGKIINIASMGAQVALTNSNGSYDASKAGVVHLSRTLATKWGRYNINVNCVSPGYVEPVFGRERSPEQHQKISERTPLGRVQRLSDLYGAVLFLASRASDFMTGQNLVIDGGHTLSTWLSPLERNAPPRAIPEVWA